MALLQELAQGYVPVLLANARELAHGEKQVTADLPAGRWHQAVVPYQAKCLRWLRAQHSALNVQDQAHAAQILQSAGIADLLHADF
jgi:hypothetical protein